ncbi:MAG: hypothetical protein H2057_04060 [Alphaproteobacteria bacterium]|nr:hypothetical protein [Alphaproteobacteria bacterium]
MPLKLTSTAPGETLKALLGAIPDDNVRLALSPFGTPERERELGGLNTSEKAGMFARVMSAILSQNSNHMTIEHIMGLLVGGRYKELTKSSAVSTLEEKIASLLLLEDVNVREEQTVSKTTTRNEASTSYSFGQNTSMHFPAKQPSGAYMLCETGTLTSEMSMKAHSVTQLLSVIEAAQLTYSPEELEKLKAYAMQTPYNSSKKLLPGDLVSFLYHKEETLDGLNAMIYATDRMIRERSGGVIDVVGEWTVRLCHYGGYAALKTLALIQSERRRLEIKDLLDAKILKSLGKRFSYEKLITHLSEIDSQDARRRYIEALLENPQDYPEMLSQAPSIQRTFKPVSIPITQLPMPLNFYLPSETEEFRRHFMASLTSDCLDVFKIDSSGMVFEHLKKIKNHEARSRIMRILTPHLFKEEGETFQGYVVQLLAEMQDPILQEQVAQTLKDVGYGRFSLLKDKFASSAFRGTISSVSHMKILMDLRELGLSAPLLKEIALLDGDLLEHRPLLFRGLLRAFGFMPSRDERARLGALVPPSLCLQEGAQILLPALVRYVSGLPTQEAQTALIELVSQGELALTALPSPASSVREDLRDLVASIEDPDIQQTVIHFCQNPQVLTVAGERAPEVVKALMALKDPFCIKDINVCLEDAHIKGNIQTVEDFFLLINARLQDKESDCFTTLSLNDVRRDIIFRRPSFPNISVSTKSTYGTHPGSQGYGY